jgi:uncharacterized protein YdeI (YjbR/CyaY-like superfamily)
MSERAEVEVRSAEELRAWLVAHHAQSESIWLVHYKQNSPHHLSWRDLVRTVLCFGWIDGQVKRLDEDRIKHLVSPRRPGSYWSGINKRHVEELAAEGLIEEAGWAAIRRAQADGSWDWLDDIENLVEPEDLRARLAASPAARAGWDGYPDSEKRGALRKLKESKRPPTRARWLETVVTNAEAGTRTFT